MIRVLAQIVFRQVCAPKGRVFDEPDRLPALCPVIEQTACISGAGHCTPAASLSPQTADAVREPEPHTQALVVLFTEV